MMELADMRDLGSRAERRAGSTPVTRTKKPGGPLALPVFWVWRIRWEKLACEAERATAAKPPSTRRVFDPCYPHQKTGRAVGPSGFCVRRIRE